MMNTLGDDWFAVGDIYFRKLNIFDMPWGDGFCFSAFKIAVCQFSGHIAMFLESQASTKPVLQIYTAAGKLISQQIWKDAAALELGWSLNEDLLIIQKAGYTTILDLNGKYVRKFSMGTEAEEREVIDARFFTIDNDTGIAVLTGGNHIYVTTSIDTPRVRRLAEHPTPSQALGSWQLVTVPLDPDATNATDSFRGPYALMSRKRTLYRADFGTIETIDLSKIVKSSCTDIISISLSSNMQFVAIYLNTGELLICNIRLTELHSHIDLKERVSVMLPNSDNQKMATSTAVINHPQNMLWLTNSAVVLQWNNLVALVGSQADIYELFYRDDVFLSQQVDGVTFITPTKYELLQAVPPALESLGRIGASCPATWLISASHSLKANSGRTNDYLLPIKQAKQMTEAISHCIEAACHAAFDSVRQKELLEAAHMGRIFLSALYTTEDNRAPVGKVKELADHAARVTQALRLLNSLAAPFIGFALTWRQFQAIGPNRLFERLLSRSHYPIAIELARIDQKLQWPKNILIQDESTCTFTRLISHWACNSTIAGTGTAAIICDHLANIVAKLTTDKVNDKTNDKPVTRDIFSRLCNCSPLQLDFAEAANQALVAGREITAEQLLEYEPRAWRQVPLLLKLSRYNRALIRSVETGDPELITTVVAALQDQAKLPPADLAMVLHRHPIALAIYQENWGQPLGDSSTPNDSTIGLTQAALLSFRQENDRAAEAKKLVMTACKETNLSSRLAQLQNAEEIYRQLKHDFMALECSMAIKLLRFQSKLEKQDIRAPVFELASDDEALASASSESGYLILPTVAPASTNEKVWIGQSLHTTLARLLASSQCERQAEQLRREFRVSEKRYTFLRLLGMAIMNNSWSEMDKMIESKKPIISIELLIKICIDGNHFEEAMKLIPKLPADRRVRYLLLTGKVDEAIQIAVREKSDSHLIQIQQYIGKSNRTVYDSITALRAQLKCG